MPVPPVVVAARNRGCFAFPFASDVRDRSRISSLVSLSSSPFGMIDVGDFFRSSMSAVLEHDRLRLRQRVLDHLDHAVLLLQDHAR